MDADFDSFIYLQQERARIFHTPRDIWHRKLRCGCDLAGCGLNLEWKGDRVIDAVNTENAVNLNLRDRPGRFATQVVGREYYFRVAITLQNVFMHSFVPFTASANAACGVHYYRATRFTGTGIEMDDSAPQLEGAMYGMKDIFESERYCCASGIEYNGLTAERLGRQGTAQREGECPEMP